MNDNTGRRAAAPLHTDFRGANERPRTDGGFLPPEGPYHAGAYRPAEQRRSYTEAPTPAND